MCFELDFLLAFRHIVSRTISDTLGVVVDLDGLVVINRSMGLDDQPIHGSIDKQLANQAWHYSFDSSSRGIDMRISFY